MGPECAPGDTQSDGDDMDLIEQALADLDGDEAAVPQEVTEDGAREILMTLIKQKINKPVHMSYKQVQQQKRDVKNSRGYRPVGGVSNNHGGTMRRDLQQLKSVTRCKNCGELGHWHRECPQKSSSSKIPPSSTGATNAGTSHGWWSLVQAVDDPIASDAAGSSNPMQAHQE
jgi:hypothetical protein